ncbi:MAG TPA: GPP34 family phosphoprotein [Streptosporangiaceae bacterium]|nr:GPP34 family phosphoprotein [Streptosporangiaceae bacterium]
MGLADEFFLIAWDTAGSGAPLLHPRATALGLAGALLGELALAQRITVWRAEVRVTDPRPVDNALGHRILHEMVNAPEHTDVRTWLAYLARNSVEEVAARLIDGGLLRAAESRVLWRKNVRYLATNYVNGAWPAVRVEKMLVNGDRMTPSDMALAALVEATGLLDTILLDRRDRTAARRYLATFMATIPPPLRDLTGHVRAAVGDAVLSYRA